MSDAKVPIVPITLDRERHLRMDMNALADFERLSGKSIMRGAREIFDQCAEECALDHRHKAVSVADMRCLLWASLVHEDESLSEREVGSMITLKNLQYVMTVLGQSLSNVMPEEQEAGEAAAPLPVTKARASTG